jgi:hypothetical protein
MPPDAALRAHMTETILLERIAELWRFRDWYRRQPNWSWWSDLAARNRVELRALVKVARRARRLSADETAALSLGDHYFVTA